MSVALISFVALTVFAWHISQSKVAAGSGTGTTVAGKYTWCGQQSQPACPPAVPGWIALQSALPGDVATQISNSQMFRSIAKAHGVGSLDVPARVHPYGVAPNPGSAYYYDDHWVVSARDSSGRECGIFDYMYDSANHRIAFASYDVIPPSDPRFGHAFPFVLATQAEAQVASVRKVTTMASAPPSLVFFPVAASYVGPQATHHWTGGGDSPENPLWLVTSTGGVPYFVGANLQTFMLADLPIA